MSTVADRAAPARDNRLASAVRTMGSVRAYASLMKLRIVELVSDEL
jgi:hypothetical protein